MKRAVALLVVTVAWGSLLQAATQAVFYVDPDTGSDANSGSLGSPFETIGQARDTVRTINSNMTGDIVVYLRGGIYSLSETLSLNSADSGDNGYRVIYRNYPYEEPILDGGKPISGWTAWSNGIYSASAGGMTFNQLVVNNRPAQRARYPEYGSPYDILSTDSVNQQIKINVSEFGNWSSLTRVQMVIASSFTSCRLRIASVVTNGTTAVVTPMDPERAAYWGWLDGPLEGTPSYFFENHLDFLDHEGEWFLDVDTDTVYYKPRADEDMSTASVYAPQLEQLLHVEDTEDLTLFGLTFQQAAWLEPMTNGMVQRQGSMRVLATYDNVGTNGWTTKQFNVVPAATYFKGIKNVRIERCVFTKMGSAAMGFDTGTASNTVVGNVFSEIAESAIVYDMDNNRNDAGDDLCSLDTFDSNYFFRIGTLYYGGTGLFAFWPDRITITHNEFSQINGLGINVGWGATTNTTALNAPVITQNRVHDTSVRALDSGGIHTKSDLNGALISQNWIYNITKRSWWDIGPERYSHGIYLDDESENTTVSSNVFLNIQDTDILVKGLYHTFIDNASQNQTTKDESGIRSDYSDIKEFWRGGALGRDLEPAESYSNTVSEWGTLFEDTFIYGATDDELDDYTVTTGAGSTAAYVNISDGSIRMSDNDSSNSDGVSLTKSIGLQSGGVACEFRVKAAQTSNSFFFQLKDADTNQAFQVGFAGNGYLRYYYQSGEYTDIAAYSVGTWYTFRVEADVEKQTFSVWIDDVLVLGDSLFFTPTGDLTTLLLYNAYQTGIFDVDYVTVESDAVVSGSMTSQGTPYTWIDQYYDTTGWSADLYESTDLSDEDGDGAAAWKEYLAGTVPTDATSVLSLSSSSSAADPFSLSWKTVRDRSYTVQSTTNLVVADWSNLTGSTLGTGGSFEFSADTTNSCQYYRVSVE
jgi:hypothetical protein